MNSKKAKCLALAALLMFVGAVFQIANDHFILGIIYFCAAAGFTSSATVYRNRAKKEKQEGAGNNEDCGSGLKYKKCCRNDLDAMKLVTMS